MSSTSSWAVAEDWPHQREKLFRDQCGEAADWPLPGAGHTEERFVLLRSLAYRDLVVGRLVEAHADAVAILSELGGPLHQPEQRWGVWAAGPPTAVLARRTSTGWRLDGNKPWCSGATYLTHALVTAACEDRQALFAVDLDDAGVEAGPQSWVGHGMAAADTRTVAFVDTPAVAVGSPGAYLDRPGFWAGAIGVAACWFGGAARVGAFLKESIEERDDPHAFAHLGVVHTSLMLCRSALGSGAVEIDHRPTSDHRLTAIGIRAAAERTAVTVVDRAGRALGPAPLAHNLHHAQLVDDLMVYVRQHHAERDLEALGRGVAAEGASWLDELDRPVRRSGS